MGILRVYLALCVVAWHSNRVFPWSVQDGPQAIQIFFIISGFYMAMVLSSQKYARARDFYLSRFLRIYPPYFVVLGVTVAAYTFTGLAFHHWHALTPYVTGPIARDGTAGVLAGTLANLTLFGQDWLTFLVHDTNVAWRISSDSNWPIHTLGRYSVIVQCWTVSLELTFYALAPFLNRLSTRALFSLIVLSTSARLLAYQDLYRIFQFGVGGFFPFEISLFLAGMLSHRLYIRFERQISTRWKVRSVWQYALAVMILLLAFHNFVNLTMMLGLFTPWYVAVLLSYLGWACLVPVLFFVFGDSRMDRFVGELSYPVYLVHKLLVVALVPIMGWLGLELRLGVAAAVSSLAVATVFYHYWIAPADRRRHRLTVAAAGAASPSFAVTAVPVASP